MGTHGAVCSSTEVYSTPGLHSVFLCIFLALPYLSLIKIKTKNKTKKHKSFLKLKTGICRGLFSRQIRLHLAFQRAFHAVRVYAGINDPPLSSRKTKIHPICLHKLAG